MNLERGDLMIQFANAFSIAITFARWRQRSEATTVPYGANLFDKKTMERQCHQFKGLPHIQTDTGLTAILPGESGLAGSLLTLLHPTSSLKPSYHDKRR